MNEQPIKTQVENQAINEVRNTAAAPVKNNAVSPENINNPILKVAEQRLESTLVPVVRKNYDKIVLAGMATALEGGQDGILYSLHQSKNPIYDAAKGALNIVLLMRRQARGTMPLKAMVPAGMTLMIKALDFIDKAGIAKVDVNTINQATKFYMEELLKAFHITGKMLDTAANNLHNTVQDPQKLKSMKQAAGIVRVPRPGTGGVINAPLATTQNQVS